MKQARRIVHSGVKTEGLLRKRLLCTTEHIRRNCGCNLCSILLENFNNENVPNETDEYYRYQLSARMLVWYKMTSYPR